MYKAMDKWITDILDNDFMWLLDNYNSHFELLVMSDSETKNVFYFIMN